MGLGRATGPAGGVGLGSTGAPAGRGARLLRGLARSAVRVDDPAAPHRRTAPSLQRARRAHQVLAVRPDGHRRAPRVRQGHRHLRRRRKALRSLSGGLPTPARQPQGRGGEGEPHRRATLVAHPARRHHGRASPGIPRRVVRAARRRPPQGPRRRARHRGRARRPRTPHPAAGAFPRDPSCRTGRVGAGAGRLPRQLLLRATATGPRPRDRHPPPRRHHHRHRNNRSHNTRWHRRKQRIPPGPAARAAAQQLRHGNPATQNPHSGSTNTTTPRDATVIDLSAWERTANGRNTLT